MPEKINSFSYSYSSEPERKRKRVAILDSDSDSDEEKFETFVKSARRTINAIDPPARMTQEDISTISNTSTSSSRSNSVSIAPNSFCRELDSSLLDEHQREMNNTLAPLHEYPGLTKSHALPKNNVKVGNFMDTEEAVEVIRNGSEVLPAIPAGVKENVRYRISDKQNVQRRLEGKKSIFRDDCGVWDSKKGRTNKHHYQLVTDGALKHLWKRNGLYAIEKKVRGKKVSVSWFLFISRSLVCEPIDVFLSKHFCAC